MCYPAWEAFSTVQETANVLTAGSTPTVQTPSALLQTFRSWVGTGLNRAYIRGVIDGGSQKTFIREDLARKLNLKVVGERIMQLNIFACSDSNRSRQKFTVVRIHIRGQYKTTDHVLEAVVVPFICQNIIETPVEHTFLKTIPGDIADKLMFPSSQVEAGISLLIGADQMWKLLTGETRHSSCNTGLVAIATTLGWTFQGPTSTVSVLSDNTTNLMVYVLNVGWADEEEDAALKHFWELETIGIVDEPMDKKQQEEKVFEQFKENIRHKNGRYEVALPWKETKTTLGDNYMIANTRLRSLVRRLTQDGSIAQYDKAIRSYFKDGHAEEIELNASTYRADNVDHSSENKPFKSPEVTNMLGLVWDKNADYFKFSAHQLLEILSTNLNTKRSVLKASARIFDPLGFLSPYVIRGKISFQRIWQCGLGWDEVLTEALLQEWKSWCADLTELPQITTPRYLLGVEGESELVIHIFTDASPLAYGTCAYLRAVNRKGEVSVNLIFSKARVASLKTLNLLRLELMGALLGARIATYLRSSLLGHTVTIWYWTDSTITLGWIKGLAAEWQPFVCNRVAEIQALSDSSSCHHCPGYENPADAFTRGKTVVQLETQQVRWSGPEWLALEQRNWPVSTPVENLEDIDGEKQQRTGNAADCCT
ncbi:uncharacterized protein LOC121837103 [Ixodes scapularis]|uniref:uncharacterized protein LOC121837103 n=1 Tax=Ixodes scapularis TaxID=6945 RepID=UPI001C380367|nr:uncharacterized protein LOC121837103 [Ixodes scapularis]